MAAGKGHLPAMLACHLRKISAIGVTLFRTMLPHIFPLIHFLIRPPLLIRLCPP
jgi:hypothetical protein